MLIYIFPKLQEAMQLIRKSKTIQQDKLRSLPTCYLANMLQDYFHNSVKHKVLALHIATLSQRHQPQLVTELEIYPK